MLLNMSCASYPLTHAHTSWAASNPYPFLTPWRSFFYGKPMTPELIAALMTVFSDDFEGRFVGEGRF